MNLSWDECRDLVRLKLPSGTPVYGVPRGGSAVAALHGYPTNTPDQAFMIVDDIVDSGRTREKWKNAFPDKPFVALIDKTRADDPYAGAGWIHFPWETEPSKDIEDSIVRVLEYIGEDPRREGLLDTPARVVRSWNELFAGYKADPAKLLARDFDKHGYDEMVVCRDIQFYSVCEHHMLPFFGRAHVGYIPDKKVVGLSKLARLVEAYARRLQIQERLTKQIADALTQYLQPLGVAVVIEAQHFCMICRGVQKQQSSMVTSALSGRLQTSEARAEFLSLIRH